MQDILNIYGETLAKFSSLRARLLNELQEIQFVLDNELCDAHGDLLDPETQTEVINSLNADKIQVQQEIDVVDIEIKHIHQCLNVHIK